LRNELLNATEELKQTKLKLNEMTFTMIKCEEQLKVSDQKNLKILYDLRHLEGIEQDNKELQDKLDRLRQDHETLQISAEAELEALKGALAAAQAFKPEIPPAIVVEPAQLAKVKTQYLEAMEELDKVFHQNEELIGQLKL
jgi:septal ring factor EnvC (AmiA/AmiB activator)